MAASVIEIYTPTRFKPKKHGKSPSGYGKLIVFPRAEGKIIPVRVVANSGRPT